MPAIRGHQCRIIRSTETSSAGAVSVASVLFSAESLSPPTRGRWGRSRRFRPKPGLGLSSFSWFILQGAGAPAAAGPQIKSRTTKVAKGTKKNCGSCGYPPHLRCFPFPSMTLADRGCLVPSFASLRLCVMHFVAVRQSQQERETDSRKGA